MKPIGRRVSATLLSLAVLLSLVLLLLAAVDKGRGPATSSAAEEWRNVTIVYTSDIKGKIDPCG
jgi:hypothetical protein